MKKSTTVSTVLYLFIHYSYYCTNIYYHCSYTVSYNLINDNSVFFYFTHWVLTKSDPQHSLTPGST